MYTQHRSVGLRMYTQHRSGGLRMYTQHRSGGLRMYTQHRSGGLRMYTQHRSVGLRMYTWINLVSHRSRCRLKYFGSQSARLSAYYPNHREGYPGTTYNHHNHIIIIITSFGHFCDRVNCKIISLVLL